MGSVHNHHMTSVEAKSRRPRSWDKAFEFLLGGQGHRAFTVTSLRASTLASVERQAQAPKSWGTCASRAHLSFSESACRNLTEPEARHVHCEVQACSSRDSWWQVRDGLREHPSHQGLLSACLPSTDLPARRTMIIVVMVAAVGERGTDGGSS